MPSDTFPALIRVPRHPHLSVPLGCLTGFQFPFTGVSPACSVHLQGYVLWGSQHISASEVTHLHRYTEEKWIACLQGLSEEGRDPNLCLDAVGGERGQETGQWFLRFYHMTQWGEFSIFLLGFFFFVCYYFYISYFFWCRLIRYQIPDVGLASSGLYFLT